ncbi:hypothetical protein [Salinibacter altiplanensis]|uniref:hypothetical protein n=1 Tax=Salinibacter altiplanensis TaxID=1803181 RepID=UPI000C9F090B|nr:hypothetical protein [Salinibacter altiplanensis]
MALASTSPDRPSPLEALNLLYPLACTLVGKKAAPSLLVRVYEQGADARPEEGPDTPEDWLALLLREAPERSREQGAPRMPGATSASNTDSLRRDTAERLARSTLPIALATCSAAEQFVLVLSASQLSQATGPNQSSTLFEEPLPTDPSALLRERLRAILSAPEADLIDETLADPDLQAVLRDVLHDHFAPIPSSLRARLRATLRSSSSSSSAGAQEAEEEEEEDAGPSASPSTPNDASDRLVDRLPSRPGPRALGVVLLLGMLVLGGGLGVSYLTNSASPSSAPPPSLTAFSAEQVGAVTPERTTTQPAAAEAYLDSTWGRRVRLPSIEDTQVQGVGRLRATDNAEIPVVLYTGGKGAQIAAFVYSYALLDRLDGTARLDAQLRGQLTQRNRLVADEQPSGNGLLWRDRATVFVVVSPTLAPDTLRARVQP